MIIFTYIAKYDPLNVLAQGLDDLIPEAQDYLERRLRNAQINGDLTQANIIRAYRSAYKLSEEKENGNR